jgi:Skp family chaperone for outer membrane proteins
MSMISSRRSFLAGGVALAAAPGQDAKAFPKVAVVNVRSCFEKEKNGRVAEATDELGKLRDQLSQEAGALQKKIADLAEAMERMSRNGDLYVEKVRQRAHAEYDLKLLQEVLRRKVRDRLGDLESRVYADIRRIVAQLAQGMNFDLVLRVDEPRLQEEDPEVNSSQRIASREVLYHRDALDVTPQVLARLAADWAKAWTCPACKRKVVEEKCPDCLPKKP